MSAPVLNRTPMAPESWPPSSKFKRCPADDNVHPEQAGSRPDGNCSPDPCGEWRRSGALRRLILLILMLGQSLLATHFMRGVLPYHGGQPLELVILVLFAILSLWVSAGFWTAIMGFLLLLRGDRYAISARGVDDSPISEGVRTAVVMPICNEDVGRVFAGLQATYRSLAQTREAGSFDFYILSDSSDPDTRVAETEAWFEMCRAVNGFGRVFYRWRQHRIKRKSGNIADFCRRWGSNYQYMVVLDADSVMSGECLTKLVRLMQANPTAGIIQTAPRTVGRDTLYARVQQFASRVYGPLFVAGLHFWQLGESHYWGHNAIIRVAPFMRHCALGRLSGRGPLSGEILSHDFVEAALMRRAGWAVWIAYDLPGSYEEVPPNLLDELKRDRRWCYGNLINFRLFPQSSFHPVHRAVFFSGVFAYVSAPLWLLSLILSTALLATHTLIEPQYFVEPNQLFPLWPQWNPERAVALFSATAALLFTPKVLSVILIIAQGTRHFGGVAALAISMLLEMIFSAALAPIRMLFHTQFVVAALTGRSLHWKSPPREDAETPWSDALRHHGLHMLLGFAWAGGVYWLNPSFLWWLLPIVGPLILSAPISVLSSRVSTGRFMRRLRLFLIPEEVDPPQELQWTMSAARRSAPPADFIEAVTDPFSNALLSACGASRSRQYRKDASLLAHRALSEGPDALSPRERNVLLSDPMALSELHGLVSTLPTAHAMWHQAKRRRHESDRAGVRRPTVHHYKGVAENPGTAIGFER